MRKSSRSSIGKYFSVFRVSFQQEIAYRFNFLMWRLRNVLQIFLVFFLWDAVFAVPGRELFGYTREQILTYVFLTILVKALVFSARAVDVSGDIARGDLSNHLLKPISYFKYWFTRDVSSKLLNVGFASIEFSVLVLAFKPNLFFQTSISYILLAALSVFIAIFIYFCILFIVSSIPFWMPEGGWGANFLLIIVLDFLSGSLFPIDVLPVNVQRFLYFTPFPYMIFFPIQIYLGNFDMTFALQGILTGGIWGMALYLIMKNVWRKGMLSYQATGK